MIATRSAATGLATTTGDTEPRASITVEELDRAVGENALLQVEVSRQMALRIVELREDLHLAKSEIVRLRGQFENLTIGVQRMLEVTRSERNCASQGAAVAVQVSPRLIHVAKLLQMGAELKLNVGCGSKPQPEYLNVDERELEGVDLICDLRALPFTNGSVAEIYAAHVIEHFTEADLKGKVLPAWHHLLKAGGRLRVAVPDAEAMSQGFVRGDLAFETLRTVTYGGQDYCGNFHYTMFSRDSLRVTLRDAGFSVGEYSALGRANGLCLEMEIEATKS
jgi:SAM-dependent methyltransferase